MIRCSCIFPEWNFSHHLELTALKINGDWAFKINFKRARLELCLSARFIIQLTIEHAQNKLLFSKLKAVISPKSYLLLRTRLVCKEWFEGTTVTQLRLTEISWGVKYTTSRSYKLLTKHMTKDQYLLVDQNEKMSWSRQVTCLELAVSLIKRRTSTEKSY